MPASAPTAELVAAIERLGGGALGLWMYLHHTAVDGISSLTSEQIATALGCDKRSVERKACILRDHGYLVGGSGMWKTISPEIQCQVTDKSVAPTTILSQAPDEYDNFVAQTTHLSQSFASPPSLTLSPPVCVREHNVVDVTFTVNERENDGALTPPSPPLSPAKKRRGKHDYSDPFLLAWHAYPHFGARSDKPKSYAKWLELSDDEQATVQQNIPAWTASHDWTRDGGQYVPAMERWLASERWRASPPPAERVVRSPKNGGYSREELLRQIAEDEGDDPLGDEENPGFAASRLAGDGDRRRADHGLPHHPLGLALPRGEWGRAVAHGRREVAAEAGRTARQGDHPARRDRPL